MSTFLRSHGVKEADVIVVGGGFSGLAAADALQRAGVRVILLEAKDRVGGRSYSFPLASGGITEYGATWINQKLHPEVYGLTKRFGLETFKQYTGGEALFESYDGSIQRIDDDGSFGSLPPSTTEKLGKFDVLLKEATSNVDPRSWDRAPKSTDISFHDWAEQNDLLTDPFVQALIIHYTNSAVGFPPDQISAQFMFNWVRSCVSLEVIGGEGDMGAQSLKLKRGTSSISDALSKSLMPGSVRLRSPVSSIEQYEESTCRVTNSSGQRFRSKKVILANPLTTYHKIHFFPPLPAQKRMSITNIRGGHFTKIILTYSRPWWREAGLVGKVHSMKGPIGASYDASGPDGEHYTLTLYLVGENAIPWHDIEDGIRRQQAVIEQLVRVVGLDYAEEARDVLEYNSFVWKDEDYISVGPILGFGPGSLQTMGKELHKPFKNIHIACSDTADEWIGYLEGAVTSGQRAAKEVLSQIS